VPNEGAPDAPRETRRPHKEKHGSPTKKAASASDKAHKKSRHAAEIAHHTRGRVRLKIPAAKQNPELLEQIKAKFSSVPGIDYIEIKPSTGSVILWYDPEHHADVPGFFQMLGGPQGHPVAAGLAAPRHHRPPSNKAAEFTQQIEDEAEFLAEHSTVARAIVEFARHCDRQIKRATDNHMDMKILVPLVLAGFTFLEIGAAAATPMWVTLVIFSLNHFVELQAHDADEGDEQS
jgi:hypothetical protein